MRFIALKINKINLKKKKKSLNFEILQIAEPAVQSKT